MIRRPSGATGHPGSHDAGRSAAVGVAIEDVKGGAGVVVVVVGAEVVGVVDVGAVEAVADVVEVVAVVVVDSAATTTSGSGSVEVELLDVTAPESVASVVCAGKVVAIVSASTLSSPRALMTRKTTATRSAARPAAAIPKRLTPTGYGLVVCRLDRLCVSPRHRRHLARRKAQSHSEGSASILDAARGNPMKSGCLEFDAQTPTDGIRGDEGRRDSISI
jgi:hypothetical protein